MLRELKSEFCRKAWRQQFWVGFWLACSISILSAIDGSNFVSDKHKISGEWLLISTPSSWALLLIPLQFQETIFNSLWCAAILTRGTKRWYHRPIVSIIRGLASVGWLHISKAVSIVKVSFKTHRISTNDQNWCYGIYIAPFLTWDFRFENLSLSCSRNFLSLYSFTASLCRREVSRTESSLSIISVIIRVHKILFVDHSGKSNFDRSDFFSIWQRHILST